MDLDIIIPRGIENVVAIDMVVHHVKRILSDKSKKHREDLRRLGEEVVDEPLSPHVYLLSDTPQIKAMNTIIQNPTTDEVDFIFYFDRMATSLIERSVRRHHTSGKSDNSSANDNLHFKPKTVKTPLNKSYHGLTAAGEVSAVVILRGG